MRDLIEEMMWAKNEADRRLLQDKAPASAMLVGDYALRDLDHEKLNITYMPTGESGVFDKAEFEAHIKAFFGLNF